MILGMYKIAKTYVEEEDRIREIGKRILKIVTEELEKGTPPMIVLGSLLDVYISSLKTFAEDFGKRYGLDHETVKDVARQYMVNDFTVHYMYLNLLMELGDECEGEGEG